MESWTRGIGPRWSCSRRGTDGHDADSRAEQAQGFYAAIAVPISLTIADGGLTQQVDRPRSPMLPKIGQLRRRLFDCCTGDKGARHMLDLASDRLAAEPGPQAGGGKNVEPPLTAEER